MSTDCHRPKLSSSTSFFRVSFLIILHLDVILQFVISILIYLHASIFQYSIFSNTFCFSKVKSFSPLVCLSTLPTAIIIGSWSFRNSNMYLLIVWHLSACPTKTSLSTRFYGRNCSLGNLQLENLPKMDMDKLPEIYRRSPEPNSSCERLKRMCKVCTCNRGL